jgi:tryptophanyl-tRNA synthetase
MEGKCAYTAALLRGYSIVLTALRAKSKLSLGSESSLEDKTAASRLKLGLFSYPVLQAADILVHRFVNYTLNHYVP